MARSRIATLAFCLLLATSLPAVADGSGSGLGSLHGIGSTQDLNRPVSGRVTGIAVDPSDSSSPRQFNGVVNRISQGDSDKPAAKPGDPSGNTVYVGSASGGVWKTTNGGTASNNAGVGFLRSMDGGRTGSPPAGGSGALQNVGGSNTWSKPTTTTPPTGPAALRAKTN
jgi:hypothetical protein